uniref:Uncharacterized protein n=1 Tax=Gossypium raimondii TaxID=29730 RepID=A0A0D2MKS4_GOSRA|nr:hypothetical protein B456_003G079200 [Gossypium raimondii]
MGSDFYFPPFPPKPNNKLRLIMFVCLVMSTHFPLPPFPPKPKFLQAKPKPSFKLCSSLSTVSVPPTKTSHKPFPTEVSRTIMELSSIGTLSTLAQDGWPLGVGLRFVVDAEGTPVLCLPQPSPDAMWVTDSSVYNTGQSYQTS